MTNAQDIRWEQRFSNYVKALDKLSQSVDFVAKNFDLNDFFSEDENLVNLFDDMIKEAIIQRFEYTYEMAWNVMKDYAQFQGDNEITGSRDAFRYAFAANLIEDGSLWMDMIKSRIQTTHTYNEETAKSIYFKIISNYYPAFLEFRNTMENLKSGKQGDLFKNE